MSNKHTITDVIKNLGDSVLNGIVEMWLLITIGLFGLLGLAGKRLLNRWDEVARTHVPSNAIDKRFSDTYAAMTDCQQELKNDISEVKDNVSEVHGRIDDIYQILIGNESNRPARSAERKKNE